MEGVSSAFSVTGVCVGAALKAVVGRPAEQHVLSDTSIEVVIAAYSSDRRCAVEVDVVAKQRVVPGATLQHIVAGIRGLAVCGAVAVRSSSAFPPRISSLPAPVAPPPALRPAESSRSSLWINLPNCWNLSDNYGMSLGPSFAPALEAAREGAPWAFEAIYRDLAPAVFGYLRGQGAAEPEDLASEVFVGIVRSLERFDGDERAFRTWVFSIAHRRLVDERRRLSRSLEEPTDPAEMSGLSSGALVGDVEEEALEMLGSGVRRAMKALSSDQRAVLLLRILADLSVAEVASILGKSQGAVKTLQRRGLRSLVRQLEAEGVS